MEKRDDADPCHDGLSPRCTPPTSKPVEHRSLAGSPTKSPSSGLHKPTWKPSSKPNEHRRLAGTPTKSPSSGLHKPTWRPSSKPNESSSSKSNVGAALPRKLAAAGPKDKDAADPCHDGLSPRCTPPTSKPVEHRSLAGSPTKSPSSGLHKPTWKPSSKPNEHRKLSGKTDKPSEKGKTNKPAEHASKSDVGAALPRTLSAVPVPSKDDADPCHDGLSPRCTPPTSKPVEHRGLSSKTDKPSEKGKTNKPAEHASKSDVGAALPRQLSQSEKALKATIKKSDAAKDDIKVGHPCIYLNHIIPITNPSNLPSLLSIPYPQDLRADIKADKKDLSKLTKDDKDALKEIKGEIKADKAAIKDDKEVVINEETGRPNGLDEEGTIHAPKLGSKLGQVSEGEVVVATSRKDAKTAVAVAVAVPADVDPTAVSVPMSYHASAKSAKVRCVTYNHIL